MKSLQTTIQMKSIPLILNNVTNSNSSYIKIQINIPKYKKYHLYGYIDTGASICVASRYALPEEVWKISDKVIEASIANGSKIQINKVAKNTKINICGEEFIFPTIYQQETGIDFIIGNNFLKLNEPFIQSIELISITHHLTKKRVFCTLEKEAYKVAQPGFPESHKKQKGEDDYKLDKPTQITCLEQSNDQESNSENYLNAISNLDKLKELLKQTSSENPLDENINNSKEIAEIKMKDPSKVIRVKPMSYTPSDREEFKRQIQELLDLKVIRPSKSPHSSPAFMVENEAEKRRGKKRMVINYKALNKETIDDGYFLPNKESLLSAIKEKVIWHWTENDTKYVKKVKNKLEDLPPLYHPKPEDIMIIESDASHQFWGGVLKAKTPQGEEHLCH